MYAGFWSKNNGCVDLLAALVCGLEMLTTLRDRRERYVEKAYQGQEEGFLCEAFLP